MDELLNTENSIENENEAQVVSEVEPTAQASEPIVAETEQDLPDEKVLEEQVPENIIPEMPEEVVPEEEVNEEDFAALNKEEILEKIRYYIHDSEKDDCKKEIDILRKLYYDRQREEHENIKRELREKAGEGVEIEMPKDPTEDYFKELMDDYHKQRAERLRRQEEIKEKNYEQKVAIIEKIKQLGTSESVSQSYNDFKALQKEWMEIGQVPAEKNKELWENYQMHVSNYYTLLKINRELRELDYKKNLEQKIALCERMEELLLEPNILTAYRKSIELFNEWKEVGPVPNDKREEIWDRFNEVRTKIYNNFHEHNEKQKAEREQNYEQKVLLCERIEAMVADDALPTNGKDWLVAGQKVLELQALWKTIGMVPTAVNNEIYERFRASCNKFFDRKKEFFDRMNSDLEENLRKKTELCITAESLQDSTDWKKTTEMFYDLQKKWKEIGPAPKKHSDQIWGRFRAACNKFFDAKSQFYSNIEAEHQMNREKKENLISEVKAFVPVEDQAQNVEKIKEFRTRWNEIGYVASADKDRLYNEFKDAINKIFSTININRNDLELSNFTSQVEMLKDAGETTALQKERSTIVRKIQDLTVEIAQIENNLGFFSSGSDSIVQEFNKKIQKIKNEISVLKEKKKAIDIAERELKGTGNE
ncbi:MAG: DUF349 domain-containing protein [Bacteroidales bacterium]|nr:DUF349 domain-containing protein [Bacteroidales bacterium]